MASVGPLDEAFGLGMFEDDDYSRRLQRAGLRVVCAGDCFVHHVGQAAFKSLIADGTYHSLFEKNRKHYERKWRTTWIPHVRQPLRFTAHSRSEQA
jgi:GT2 family glycosyltransferase